MLACVQSPMASNLSSSEAAKHPEGSDNAQEGLVNGPSDGVAELLSLLTSPDTSSKGGRGEGRSFNVIPPSPPVFSPMMGPVKIDLDKLPKASPQKFKLQINRDITPACHTPEPKSALKPQALEHTNVEGSGKNKKTKSIIHESDLSKKFEPMSRQYWPLNGNRIGLLPGSQATLTLKNEQKSFGKLPANTNSEQATAVVDLSNEDKYDSELDPHGKFRVAPACVSLKSWMLSSPEKITKKDLSDVETESVNSKSSRSSGILSGPISLQKLKKPGNYTPGGTLGSSETSHKSTSLPHSQSTDTENRSGSSELSPRRLATAVSVCKKWFPALAEMNMVEDVLVSVGDINKAFEKLQLLEDEYLAAHSQETPDPAPQQDQVSWDEKLAQLAHEFPDVEGGKISQILHSTDGDSVQAKALVSIENSSVQQRLQMDRLMAEELSQIDIATAKKHSYQQDQESSSQLSHISSLFPSTNQDILSTALTVCGGNSDMAIEILKIEGHDYVAPIPQPRNIAPITEEENLVDKNSRRSSWAGPQRANLQNWDSPLRSRSTSRSNSPGTRQPASRRFLTPQDIYLEFKKPEMEIQAEIDLLKARSQSLKAGGQHLAATNVESKIRTLIMKKLDLQKSSGDKIYKEINKDNLLSRPVDLHSCSVKGALKKLEYNVDRSIEERDQDTHMQIITGRGNGSVDNIPKIKNAVIKYLDERGILWYHEGHNDGEIRCRIIAQKPLKPYHEYLGD